MVGQVTTQGDRALRADVARTLFGLDGAGIRIGVISNGYDSDRNAVDEVQAGDLPGKGNPKGNTQPVRVLQDNRFSLSDEGRAMLQIIHDIAPKAELLFHAVGESEADMANAIRALADAGADIIVDDIGFPSTLLLQDGVLSEAIAEVTAQGIAYFSSAGNDGDRGYQSVFRAGASFQYQGITYEAHNFSSTGEVDLFQSVQIPASNTLSINLNWDQPRGSLENDVDLFLLSTTELPGAADNTIQNASITEPSPQEPVIRLDYDPTQSQTVYLLIARRVDGTAPPGYLTWSSVANNGDASVVFEYVNDGSASPVGATVYGHSNAQDAIAVGAASFRNTPAFGVAIPQLETFSSRGGIPILFSAAGDRLPSPKVRQKPAVVAVDQVSTTVPGFERFPGTSAAAPHAAAVAALMLQRAGGSRALTPAQLLAALETSALAFDPPGNLRSGAGLIQADGAVLQAFFNQIEGSDSSDTLEGTPQADNLYGHAGDDQLQGLQGFDALWGGDGNDSLLAGQGNDYGLGESGDDLLSGGIGQDLLMGGQGADRLTGNGGRDRLRGGAGNDSLNGGKGTNWLTGHLGNDQFVLVTGAIAIIRDFGRGADKLMLSPGLSVEALVVAESGQDTVIQSAGVQLAILKGVSADRLTASSFITT